MEDNRQTCQKRKIYKPARPADRLKARNAAQHPDLIEFQIEHVNTQLTLE
jgi:hypothetical protein